MKEILDAARAQQYAVAAFNIHNLEIGLAIVQGASTVRSPVILQASEASLTYGCFDVMVALMKSLAASTPTPVALHLDHGRNFAIVRACVDAGFSSVMRDASELPFLDNIREVSAAVAYAHAKGVLVQGELGGIAGKEGEVSHVGKEARSAMLTSPQQAAQFVAETGVDALAVSVGTMHGAFVGEEYIDQERISDISRMVSLPLVLHGASGIALPDLAEAVARGIRCVNIDTELRRAFTVSLQHTLAAPVEKYDPRVVLQPSRSAMQRVVEDMCGVLGSAGKGFAI